MFTFIAALAFATVGSVRTYGEFALSLPDLVSPTSGCSVLATHDGVSPRSGIHVPFDNHGGSGTTGAKFSATDGNAPKVYLPLVDGVFTLDGKSKISSTGLDYLFPATQGAYNYDAIRDGIVALDANDSPRPIELGDLPGVIRGGIGIPGNTGITFDLAEIRAKFPGASIARVEGTLGISVDGTLGTLSFHVLADAVPVVEAQLVGVGAFLPLHHVVPESAEFLTIAVADLSGTTDFDGSAVADLRLVLTGNYVDCNGNQMPDPCDLELGTSKDCDFDSRPDDCEWLATPYGSGHPGGGGFVPQAQITGCVTTNSALFYDLSKALGGALAFVVVGPTKLQMPTDLGPDILVGGAPTQVVPFTLGGFGPGKGVVTVIGSQPYGLLSYSALYVQTFVVDPNAAGGFAATCGLELRTFSVN